MEVSGEACPTERTLCAKTPSSSRVGRHETPSGLRTMSHECQWLRGGNLGTGRWQAFCPALHGPGGRVVRCWHGFLPSLPLDTVSASSGRQHFLSFPVPDGSGLSTMFALCVNGRGARVCWVTAKVSRPFVSSVVLPGPW